MATDSRVVPSATFSTLGGGKVDGYEPLLDIPAVPVEAENEFDEKNDETFGCADFNEDWELDHERFAQEEAGFFDFNSFGEPLESGAAHDSNRSSNQDEDFMEESIKHLVVEEKLDDTAILNAS